MKTLPRTLVLSMGLLFFAALEKAYTQENTPKIETNTAGAASDPTTLKTDEEASQRQERDFQFNEALQDGDRLVEAKEYDKAIVKYDFVMRNVPSYKPQFDAAKLGLARIKVIQADDALSVKDYAKARVLIAEAKDLNTGDLGVNRAIAKFEEIYAKWDEQKKNVAGIENNPAVTPQLKENIQQIDKLFYEGDRLKETGQLDAARNRYERVLAIDKYNKSARQRMEGIQKEQLAAAVTARQSTRKEAMNQVTEKWSEPVLMENVVESRPLELNTTISNVAKMRRKLEEIIIKEISFNEAPIEDVVSFLTAKSREADPTGEGVNFVLKQGGSVAPTLSAVASKNTSSKSSKIPPVTITLSNLPLGEVLRFINTTTGLKTQIDDYAVVLLPQSDDATSLATRTFSVPAGFLSTSGTSKGGALDVKKDLTDKGVSFSSEQSKAIFLASTSKLVVKNTQDQLDVIQSLIDAVALKEDPQVEIEARLIEFTDDALKELSFNYLVGLNGTNRSFLRQAGNAFSVAAPNVSSQSALFTSGLRDSQNNSTAAASQFPTAASTTYGGLAQNKIDSLLSLFPFTSSTAGVIYPQTPNALSAAVTLNGNAIGILLRAIDQLTGVDTLFSPKIVTRNRTTAKVDLGREMKYPSAYEPPEVASNTFDFAGAGNARLPIPATPSDFKTETIGVVFSVTPTTYPDQRIDIKLDQEVKDFEGFINYGSPIVIGARTSAVVTNMTDGTLNQPVFNLRKFTTDLTVMNGQTIVMGGFIREDRQIVKDKIPLLGDIPYFGRLFRSEVDKSVKKNLMLLLTARLVNSKGKPFYEMPEDSIEVSSK